MTPGDLFRALGSDIRLSILQLLALQDGTLTVDTLTERLNERGWMLTQPTVSFHLRALKQAGLITYTARGLKHFYRVEPRVFEPVTAWLTAFAQEEARV